jgi:hypothetical protein
MVLPETCFLKKPSLRPFLMMVLNNVANVRSMNPAMPLEESESVDMPEERVETHL